MPVNLPVFIAVSVLLTLAVANEGEVDTGADAAYLGSVRIHNPDSESKALIAELTLNSTTFNICLPLSRTRIIECHAASTCMHALNLPLSLWSRHYISTKISMCVTKLLENRKMIVPEHKLTDEFYFALGNTPTPLTRLQDPDNLIDSILPTEPQSLSFEPVYTFVSGSDIVFFKKSNILMDDGAERAVCITWLSPPSQALSEETKAQIEKRPHEVCPIAVCFSTNELGYNAFLLDLESCIQKLEVRERDRDFAFLGMLYNIKNPDGSTPMTMDELLRIQEFRTIYNKEALKHMKAYRSKNEL